MDVSLNEWLSEETFFVDIVYKCLVDEACAARGGVMAGEVPVSWMVGASLVQSLDTLEDEFNGCLHTFRSEHLHDFPVDFLDGERFVERAHVVLHHLSWVLQLVEASLICVP